MLYFPSHCCLPCFAIPKRDWDGAWKWYWWSLWSSADVMPVVQNFYWNLSRSAWMCGAKKTKTNVRCASLKQATVSLEWAFMLCVKVKLVCTSTDSRHKTHPSLIRCLWVSASSMLVFYMECFHQDIPICESVLGTLGTAGVRQHIRGKIWWKCGNWGVQAEAQGCVDASCAMCPWSDILIK